MEEKGFTLLEMIVALAVFTVVILISLSTLFSVTNAQRKAVAIQNSLDNLRFALEAMSKEVRTGSSFHCGSEISLLPQDCSAGTILTFLNADGQQVSYYRSGEQFIKQLGAASPQPLTATAVKIKKFSFYVAGAPAGDKSQPRITAVLEGSIVPAGTGDETTLNLEITISQRKLDS